MVKIPGFDNLKKMGSDLMDSAKGVDLSGMVGKFKTEIESVSKKASAPSYLGDDPLGALLQEANVVLSELLATNTAQAAAMKKLQNQLTQIASIAATYQKPVVPPVLKQEDENK